MVSRYVQGNERKRLLETRKRSHPIYNDLEMVETLICSSKIFVADVQAIPATNKMHMLKFLLGSLFLEFSSNEIVKHVLSVLRLVERSHVSCIVDNDVSQISASLYPVIFFILSLKTFQVPATCPATLQV